MLTRQLESHASPDFLLYGRDTARMSEPGSVIPLPDKPRVRQMLIVGYFRPVRRRIG